jgi:hypothetical protein
MRIEKRDQDGDLLVRDGLVAVFFMKVPHPQLAAVLSRVYEEWLARTPAEAKLWGTIGANADETKPMTAKLLSRSRDELDPKRAKVRDLNFVEIGGPEEENPAYRFYVESARDLDDDETNVIEIRSPSGEANAASVERYVAAVKALAEQLPYESGYASLALLGGSQSQESAFGRAARRWAFRHPGFDLPNSDGSNTGIGERMRGAYWLTFVGPRALKKVGGKSGLRSILPDPVQLDDAGVGVVLRAGTLPEVGDVNKGQRLPLVRAVAKALESVSMFDDTFLNVIFDDADDSVRWQRRHID